MEMRIFNTLLRITTLSARFVFIIFLARMFDPVLVGRYGLFTAALGFLLFAVGLDFYMYVVRELLKAPDDERGLMLKTHALLSLSMYAFCTPIALIVFRQMGWPSTLLWWAAPILLLEYANQELYRLLVSLSKPVAATWVLFMRQGSWAIVSVAVMYFIPNSRSLNFVFSVWFVAGLAAAAAGVYQVQCMGFSGWTRPVQWNWVWRGLRVSLFLLVATLAVRAVQTFDRYWIEYLVDIQTVAAYVLFLGLAGALMVFLDASTFAFAYPEIIKLTNEQQSGDLKGLVNKLVLSTAAISTIFAVLSAVFLPLLLDWIGKPIYKDAQNLYWWVLTATVLNALAMVPHYVLFARGRDHSIFFSHLLALPVFGLICWTLQGSVPKLAVPAALVAAFLFIFIWKFSSYFLLQSE